MGKYDAVINKLPRTFGKEPPYQEKITAVMNDLREKAPRLSGWSAGELAYEYRRLRAQKEEIERVVSDVTLEMEAYSQLMVEQFEVEGVFTVKLSTDGSSISVQYEPHAVIEDKEAFRVWCLANGFEKEMVLPWMSANSFVKELLLAGETDPPGVTTHSRPKIVLRKG